MKIENYNAFLTASANSNSLSTYDLVANTAGNEIMEITSIKVDGDLGYSGEYIDNILKNMIVAIFC